MKQEYFESDDFKEILENYTTSREQGGICYLDADDFASIADYYISNGNPLAGMECLEMAMKVHPDEEGLRTQYSGYHIFMRDFVKARAILESLPEDAMDTEDVMYQRGQLAYALDKDTKASDALFLEWIGYVEESCKEDTTDERVRDCYMHIITTYIELDDDRRKARKQAGKWVKKYLERFDSIGKYDEDLIIANIIREEYMTELVVEFYSRILVHNPYLPHGWTILATAQNIEGKIQDSMDSCDFALAIDADDAEAMITKAHNHYAMGDIDSAVSCFDKCIDKFPDGSNSLVYGLCLIMVGRLKEGAVQAKMALEFVQCLKERDTEYYANSCRDIAEALLLCNDEDLEVGLKAIDMAISADDSNPEFYLTKGSLLLNMQKSQEAMQTFSEVLQHSDKIDMAVLEVGLRLIYQNHGDLAIDLFNKVDETCEASDEYNRIESAYRALAYFYMDNVEAFLENLQKACKACPDMVGTLFASRIPEGTDPAAFYEYVVNNPLSSMS